MKWRNVYLEKDLTLATAGTKTVNIDIVDPISYLMVKFNVTNDADIADLFKLSDKISKVEVVDGSEVFFAMSMAEARGLNFYEMGQLPPINYNVVDSGVQSISCFINFGRYLGDLEYMLDPAKFKNPQLKLTYDVSADLGCGDTAPTLDVMAKVLDEGAPAIRGFLMSKKQYAFNATAAGTHYIDLPCDYPYRFLMVKVLETNKALSVAIDNLKLNVDADKYIPYDIDGEEFVAELRYKFGVAHEKIIHQITHTLSLLTDIYDMEGATCIALTDNFFAVVAVPVAEDITVQQYEYTGAGALYIIESATEKATIVAVTGQAPYACGVMSFGNKDVVEDYLPAETFGSMRLELTVAYAAANASSVISQQVRS